jgi:EmrB/QacA subfamily drug resistance transporter
LNENRRRATVFTIIALALLLMSVDSTIVATALHNLQKELSASINWTGWTITAYSFGYMLMLPISGKLSERYGCFRVFLGSVAVFTAASLFCALATDIYMLIALRGLQAAGGAGFTPSATGLIVQHFGRARDRAVGLFGSIFPVGSMIGPIFGGLFVTYWTWRGIFFVNVPIGIAVVVLALRYIPRDCPRLDKSSEKMDAIGMALLSVGLLAGMFAATYLGEKDTRAWSPEFLAPALVAIVSVWALFRHIHRSRQPFFMPHMIHGPGFGAVNLINIFYGGLASGVIALIPLYAAYRYHLDALASGSLLVAQGAASLVLSFAGALANRRTGFRMPLYIGSAAMAIGMVLLALKPMAGLSPYAWLAGSAFLVGAGSGAIDPASRNAGLQLMPEHSATLAAIRSMCFQIGAIATISVATAILANSGHPGIAQAWFYAVAGLLLLAMLPLITYVPEHHGSW